MSKKIGLMFVLFFIVNVCLISFPSSVYAGSLISSEEYAISFLEAQYEEKDFIYDELSIHSVIDLYDEADNIIGQCVILKRDEVYDYVIINCVSGTIDEFGFEDNSILSRFNSTQKNYYAGIMSYYTKESGDTYKDNYGRKMKKSVLNSRIKSFKKSSKEIKYGAPVHQTEGFIGFLKVDSLNKDHDFYDSEFIPGIYRLGIFSNTLSFKGLNYYPGYTNHCMPTALTNMYIYYEWLGFDNALKNGSITQTFERIKVLCNYQGSGISFPAAKSALKAYAKEQGYKYDMDTYFWGTDWNYFKGSINKGRPALTAVSVKLADGSTWNHGMLTVGYEEYRSSYKVKVLWWYETRYTYYRYLRVIDGDTTSNSGRFVYYDGFFDSIYGADFMLK